jgi:hypothetical protein
MLEADLGQADIAGTAQMHSAHTLRERSLNAGVRTMLGGVRLLGLTHPGGRERGMFLACRRVSRRRAERVPRGLRAHTWQCVREKRARISVRSPSRSRQTA